MGVKKVVFLVNKNVNLHLNRVVQKFIKNVKMSKCPLKSRQTE